MEEDLNEIEFDLELDLEDVEGVQETGGRAFPAPASTRPPAPLPTLGELCLHVVAMVVEVTRDFPAKKSLVLPADVKTQIYRFLEERALICPGPLRHFLPSDSSSLSLSENHFIDDTAAYEISQVLGSTLTQLRVNDCHLLTDFGVAIIAHAAPNLETIYLGGCPLVTHRAIDSLRENCSSLTEIDASESVSMDDRALLSMLLIPRIRIINLAECSHIECKFTGFEDKLFPCETLQSICLRSAPLVNEAGLEVLLPLLPQLRILDLSFCNTLTNRLFHIIKENRVHETLFSLNVWGSSDITDVGIETLTSCCTQMTSLSICDCPNVTEASIVQLIAQCSKLHTLNLWGCSGIHAVSLQLLLKYMTNLRSLGLSHNPHIRDFSLVGLEASTGLQSLELDSCRYITDEGIEKLGNPSMRVVNIKSCTAITEKGILNVLKRSPNVVSLTIANCTQFTAPQLRQISTMCSSIRSLNLSDCRDLDARSLMFIANKLRDFLSTLKLDRCVRLTDASIQFAIRRVRNLDELSLQFCTQLTDMCLLPPHYRLEDPRELPEGVARPNRYVYRKRGKFPPDASLPVLPLRSLYLGGNMNMTEASVCFFVTRTPFLKHLSIPAIMSVDDTTLIRIGKLCPRLQHLNLSLCSRVTNHGVRGILRRCRNVKFLDLGSVDAITDMALQAIQDGCPALKSLDLSKTKHLTEAGVRAMALVLTSLVSLRLRALDAAHRYSASLFDELAEKRPELKIIKDY